MVEELFFDSNQARDILDKIILVFEKAKVDYGDARFNQGFTSSISKDKEEENVNYGNWYGFHLRVFKQGEWRVTGITSMETAKILESAKKLAGFTSTEKPYRMEPQPPWKMDRIVKPKKETSFDERLKWVRDCFEVLKNFNPKIADATCSLGSSMTEKIFANTEGTKLKEKTPKSRAVFFALAKDGSNIQQDYHSIGKIDTFDITEGINIDEISKKICTNAINLLKAKLPPSGKFPVILDGDMAGLIAHESFGHGTEADQVLRNRSFLKNYFNEKVAGDFVTLCDSGNIGVEHGTFLFDDEGVKSRRNALIDHGVFKSWLHSRETASVLGMPLTGNGRAQDYIRRVNVRMTNTYFEPGEWEVEELFKGIKYGIYLTRASHGMEDPEGGGIQVSSNMGWLIENGKKTQFLRGMSLTGRLLDVLKNIDAVAKDFDLRPGSCGKGYEDFVSVTTGGPHIRIKEATVSGG
ncbi:MAG: TldD/PmbA family protein [Candidatus Aenigmatarchaeota archaeon]